MSQLQKSELTVSDPKVLDDKDIGLVQVRDSHVDGFDPALCIPDFAGVEYENESQGIFLEDNRALVIVDDAGPAHCCHSGHCCNPKCMLTHVGSTGYSIENAALYSDTFYSFAMAVGMLDNAPLWVVAMSILLLMSVSLTLGNYRSYLSIMDRFLSGFSCFGEDEHELITDQEDGQCEGFWNGIVISNAIIKVAVPCYSVFRFSSFIFNGLLSFESRAPSIVTTVVLGASAIPASFAFFYEGNRRRVIQDPDAILLESRARVLELPLNIAQDRQDNFKRVFKNPRRIRFEGSDEVEPVQPENAIVPVNNASESRCCARKCCCGAESVCQHYGASGYSLLNAVAYSNSALSFFDSLGFVSSHPILSCMGLMVVTGSVTIANYSAYFVIMGNLLSRCFPASEDNEAETPASRFAQNVVKVNIVPATFFKVGISSISFFRVSNRVARGTLPVSLTCTLLVSTANILATTALFSLKNKSHSRTLEDRVEELSDDEENDAGMNGSVETFSVSK